MKGNFQGTGSGTMSQMWVGWPQFVHTHFASGSVLLLLLFYFPLMNFLRRHAEYDFCAQYELAVTGTALT
jgi:hypothetical protein